MNVGFTHSGRIADFLTAMGYSQIAVSASQWLPVLVGGCIAGLIYCIVK